MYGVGGYRLGDCVRIGVPLDIVLMIRHGAADAGCLPLLADPPPTPSAQ
jgi:hypothetical protein